MFRKWHFKLGSVDDGEEKSKKILRFKLIWSRGGLQSISTWHLEEKKEQRGARGERREWNWCQR